MSTLTDRLETLWGTIKNPENLTSLLESFTLWGLIIPVALFVLAWIFKEPKAQKACLVLVALAALAPFAVPAPDATPLPGGTPWVYVSLAALTGLTFLLGKGGKAGLWLTILTLLGSLAVAAFSLSIILDPPLEVPSFPDLIPAETATPAEATYPAEGEYPGPE